MTEQFNVDIRLIFAILNGKVSAAINRKLSKSLRDNGIPITPEQWVVLVFLWKKDGSSQQELCNATFMDKPSMVVRISDKNDRRSNLVYLTKDGKKLELQAFAVANQALHEGLQGIGAEELRISQEVLRMIFLNTKE